MIVGPPDPKTLVACPNLCWAGLLEDAMIEPGDVARCPRCGTAVLSCEKRARPLNERQS